MKFDSNKKKNTVALVSGFIFSYLLFSSILFLVLWKTNHLPPFPIPVVAAITAVVVGAGALLRRVL